MQIPFFFVAYINACSLPVHRKTDLVDNNKVKMGPSMPDTLGLRAILKIARFSMYVVSTRYLAGDSHAEVLVVSR